MAIVRAIVRRVAVRRDEEIMVCEKVGVDCDYKCCWKSNAADEENSVLVSMLFIAVSSVVALFCFVHYYLLYSRGWYGTVVAFSGHHLSLSSSFRRTSNTQKGEKERKGEKEKWRQEESNP